MDKSQFSLKCLVLANMMVAEFADIHFGKSEKKWSDLKMINLKLS